MGRKTWRMGMKNPSKDDWHLMVLFTLYTIIFLSFSLS